jgi:hypothetical protein
MDPWSAGMVLEPVVAFEPQPANAITVAKAAAERVSVLFM